VSIGRHRFHRAERHDPLSRSRRDRILKVIKELGYSQNMLVRGLRGKLKPVVGINVPTTAIAYFLAVMDEFDEVASTNVRH